MKCPKCSSHNLIAVTTIGPYVIGKGEVNLNKLPRKIKYTCKNCGYKFKRLS